jgi:ribonuclease P protein component
MVEKRFGLPREQRVRKRKDFDRVFQDGGSVRAGLIYGRYLPNGTSCTRIGVAVPNRFGKAAKRNRARRLLKEAYRLHKHEMPPGLDIILLPGTGWNKPPLGAVEECMGRIARKLSEKQPGTGKAGFA